MGYPLALSDEERTRYRFMAANARRTEAGLWEAAGIIEGAEVADVGCGPGAVLAALARVVGPTGRVVGVDSDPQAVEWANEEVIQFPQASACVGNASDSGLELGFFDVAMCRHVLLHNGPAEQDIVDHLADLVRPGGAVYLVDSFGPATSMWPDEPLLSQLNDAYMQLLSNKANDMRAGLRMGALLQGAGLEVEHFAADAPVFQVPAGLRPPAWAARLQLVKEGVASLDDVERWAKRLAEFDRLEERPWFFAATFVAVGRKPERDLSI